MKVFSGFLLVFSLTYFSQSLAQITVQQNPQKIEAGSQGSVILNFAINDRCRFEFDSSDPAGFNLGLITLSGNIGGAPINPADFSVNFQDATFTLSVDAALNQEYTLFYRAVCNSNPESEIIVSICVCPPNAGIECDPHFNQYVFNRETNETTRICYDVTAEPNQYLEIFTQPKMATRLVGQMKDDYYMHRIIMQLDDHIIEADVDKVLFFSGKHGVFWRNIVYNHWTPFRGMLFRQSKNMVEIKRHENDEFTFGIVRSRDSVGKHYLDVFVNGLSNNYSGLGGLLGRIGNNKISIYPNVQSSNMNGKTTIVVNGMKTVGYEKFRYGKECMLINVNDLLHPMKLNDFIVNEI